jgi:hypothetical protein
MGFSFTSIAAFAALSLDGLKELGIRGNMMLPTRKQTLARHGRGEYAPHGHSTSPIGIETTQRCRCPKKNLGENRGRCISKLPLATTVGTTVIEPALLLEFRS